MEKFKQNKVTTHREEVSTEELAVRAETLAPGLVVPEDEAVSTEDQALNAVATVSLVVLPPAAAVAAEMATVPIGFTAGAVQAVMV